MISHTIDWSLMKVLQDRLIMQWLNEEIIARKIRCINLFCCSL